MCFWLPPCKPHSQMQETFSFFFWVIVVKKGHCVFSDFKLYDQHCRKGCMQAVGRGDDPIQSLTQICPFRAEFLGSCPFAFEYLQRQRTHDFFFGTLFQYLNFFKTFFFMLGWNFPCSALCCCLFSLTTCFWEESGSISCMFHLTADWSHLWRLKKPNSLIKIFSILKQEQSWICFVQLSSDEKMLFSSFNSPS